MKQQSLLHDTTGWSVKWTDNSDDGQECKTPPKTQPGPMSRWEVGKGAENWERGRMCKRGDKAGRADRSECKEFWAHLADLVGWLSSPFWANDGLQCASLLGPGVAMKQVWSFLGTVTLNVWYGNKRYVERDIEKGTADT